jgi:hypothetical protein
MINLFPYNYNSTIKNIKLIEHHKFSSPLLQKLKEEKVQINLLYFVYS